MSIVLALVVSLIVTPALAGPSRAVAADTTGLTAFYTANDVSKGWVDLSQSDTSYLRAVQAGLSSGLKAGGDAVHGTTVSGWTSTAQTFTWSVRNATAQSFAVDVLIGNGAGTISVSSVTASVSRTYASTDGGWNKLRYGNLEVPAGTSTITVRATAGTNLNMSLLALELAPASRVDAIDAAEAAGRSTATWMSSNPIGVFYQWGQWGAYPDGTQPAWPVVYQNADFGALADRVRSMGAGYVVWSVTWAQYYVAAPIAAVDAVLPGRTTTRDYLGEMIAAFKSRGLRVVFYYHDGHDNNPNPDWWNAFWTVPSTGFWARKEQAMARWLDIMTEMGNRYGTGLDGWMFDDGATYYPAPAAMVNTALRAGNPQRVFSFNTQNPSNGPRYTDYQDFVFGEGNSGYSYPLTAGGRVASGGGIGQQAFGNIRIEQGDWGVRTGDTGPITPSQSQAAITSIAQHAADTKQSIALDMRMWSDLTQSRDSIASVTAANDAWQSRATRQVIDDAAASYTGTWQSSNPGGCSAGTCHNSRTDGSTAEVSFTGSSITWNSITGPDQGTADVYVDGTLQTTVNLNSSARVVGAPVYTRSGLAVGPHTLKIVTRGTAWVSVDGFTVTTTVDDAAPAVAYAGSWSASNPGGCASGTCHNTTAQGASATLSFTGTAVTWNSIVGPDQGRADVYVDGTLVRTVDLYNQARTVGRAVHTTTGLSSGNHTLKIVTKGGGWVSVDGFAVRG